MASEATARCGVLESSPPPEAVPALVSRDDEPLARLASEVAITSESMAAILSSLTEHLADDKLLVRTIESQPAEAGAFPEWSQLQQELQGSASPDAPSSNHRSPLARLVSRAALAGLVSRTATWSRERPVPWTSAVFLSGLLFGWLLTKLA